MNVYEVAFLILEARSYTKPKLDLLNQVEILLQKGKCVYFHTMLMDNFRNNICIESFSIKVTECIDENNKLLPFIFLKNALKSHLYFSQFNSWKLSNQIPSNVKYSCVMSYDSVLTDESNNSYIKKQLFPISRCVNWKIEASVKWIMGPFSMKNFETTHNVIPQKIHFAAMSPGRSILPLTKKSHFKKMILTIRKDSLRKLSDKKQIFDIYFHVIIVQSDNNEQAIVILQHDDTLEIDNINTDLNKLWTHLKTNLAVVHGSKKYLEPM